MENSSIGNMMRMGGLVTAGVSLVAGTVFTFAMPTSCSIIGSLGMVFFFFLAIVGAIVFLSGLVIEKRKRTSTG